MSARDELLRIEKAFVTGRLSWAEMASWIDAALAEAAAERDRAWMAALDSVVAERVADGEPATAYGLSVLRRRMGHG